MQVTIPAALAPLLPLLTELVTMLADAPAEDRARRLSNAIKTLAVERATDAAIDEALRRGKA